MERPASPTSNPESAPSPPPQGEVPTEPAPVVEDGRKKKGARKKRKTQNLDDAIDGEPQRKHKPKKPRRKVRTNISFIEC